LDETRDIVQRLKEKFPNIQGPAAQDICYATENRQVAVKAVVPLCEVLLVVGSQNSSNSRRLVEVCEKMGVPAYLVDDLTEVQPQWLENIQTIAVTAGASAPENLVEQLVEFLQQRGFAQLEEMEVKEEDVRFNLPAELTRTVHLQTRSAGGKRQHQGIYGAQAGRAQNGRRQPDTIARAHPGAGRAAGGQ